MPNNLSRHSNPVKFSPREMKLTEIEKITESPEYKNTKYMSFNKNTISQKASPENEFDEYDVFESPQANTSTDKFKQRGLIINASGSKKTIKNFNRTNEHLNNALKFFDGSSKTTKNTVGKEGAVNKSMSKDSYSNFVESKIYKSNNNQLIRTGVSPSKKGVNMIPIKSKQNDTPDSFERENTGDEVHAELLPQERRKKNKRNIAHDFNTLEKSSLIKKHLKYEEINQDRGKILLLLNIAQNPFISPQRSKILFGSSNFEKRITAPLEANLSSENDEYDGAMIRSRKPHLFNIDERKSLPEDYENWDDLKHKNTPLKSISTKTKESLSFFNKVSVTNKSLEDLHYHNYETILKRKGIYQPRNQDSPTLAI